jgi:hypothetical protein
MQKYSGQSGISLRGDADCQYLSASSPGGDGRMAATRTGSELLLIVPTINGYRRVLKSTRCNSAEMEIYWILFLLLALTFGQVVPPPPPPPNPAPAPSPEPDITDFGGLLSQSTTVSCAILDVDKNKTPFKGCNNATLLIFGLIPGTTGGGISYDFKVQGSAVQGPGQDYDSTTPGGFSQQQCLQDPPNVCSVAGVGSDGSSQTVRVTLEISRAVATYPLTWTGINGPFLYVYRNCVSPIRQPQTDDLVDKCGLRFSPDIKENYVKCPPASQPDGDGMYFGYKPDLGPYYTLCAADCAAHIAAVQAVTGEVCFSEKNRFYIDGQYLSGALGTQGEQWVDGDGNPFNPTEIFEDFPIPSAMCPCQLTQTHAQDQTYSPIYACRSGSCAGTCGSALLCDDPTSSGVCTNTNQSHRCLKCQPDKAPLPANLGPACIYPDLDRRLTCVRTVTDRSGRPSNLISSSICPHGGDNVVGPGNIAQTGGIPIVSDFFFERDLLARQCNCDGYWVDRAYWTAPTCVAYRVQNPQIPEYTVTATIENLSTGVTTVLEVGVGLDTTGQQLPRLDATDNFLLTLINDDKPQGNLGSEILGDIVMCDGARITNPANGQDLSCSQLPTAGISPSPTVDGRTNPWSVQPNLGAGKLPLPEYVFPDADARAAANASWWYFVGLQRRGTIGRTCNEWGWAPNGWGDTRGGNTLCGGLQGTCVPGFDTTTNGDVTVTPSYVAQTFAKYIVRNNESVISGDGIVEEPQFMPPGWSPTIPNMWIQDGKLYFDDSTLQTQLVVRVGFAINTELIEQLTTVGGGHLEPFTEDIESTGNRQNCLLQPQLGYGTLWVRIVNDGTTAASYTLRLNCTQGISPLSGNQQDLTFGVNPGDSAGKPVSVVLAITISVFEDPSIAACTVELTPTAYGNIVMDSVVEKCAFSRIFTSIGPLGGGLFANTSIGGLFGNLTGPIETNFCDMFPIWCDIFLSPETSNGFSQTMVMMIALLGILILIAYCASKFGQVMFSESALNLQRAKIYRNYEKSLSPSSFEMRGITEEQRQQIARAELAKQQNMLAAIQRNTNSKIVRENIQAIGGTSSAAKYFGSADTTTQFAGLYAPSTLDGGQGYTGQIPGSGSGFAAETSSAVAELLPTSFL